MFVTHFYKRHDDMNDIKYESAALVLLSGGSVVDGPSTSTCASCGIAEVDEITLEECTDCKLVRYCSDECRRGHMSHHEEACQKRAAELRDELLFEQPESSYLGDCPICMLPMRDTLSIETTTIMMPCCSKVICRGCFSVNNKRLVEESLDRSCLFCRAPMLGWKEGDKQRMKRREINDPAAMTFEGLQQLVQGDYSSAFEWYTKAARLGDVVAHFALGLMYLDGLGVEEDRRKKIHHLEEAAIGGHPDARHILGCDEWDNGNTERAVKHWIIAASLGEDSSIKALMDVFKKEDEMISKEDLAASLRAHHAAVDATKSLQREAAAEITNRARLNRY